jgi:hypothetical protein
MCRVQIRLDDGEDVARREGMQVERRLNRDSEGVIVHCDC